MITLFDSVQAATVHRTKDGYLAAVVPVARTGVQIYAGHELGKPEVPFIRLYRPESVVFGKDAMTSYAHRPMTNGHPKDQVNSKNWKQLTIGHTGGEVLRDGDLVRVPILMMDEAAINDYEAGKVELSMGYSSNIKFNDGVTPEGEAYDAEVTSTQMNHLALVQKARGGSKLRIGDSPNSDTVDGGQKSGGFQMPNETKIVIVDGLQVETTNAGAQAIEKLQRVIADHATVADNVRTSHAAAIALKDADLAKKDAEIDALKAKVLTDAQIDAAAAARGDLLAKAKSIHDSDYTGKSAADIHKAAVAFKLGDAAVVGKSADYLAVRFDMLADEAAKPDPMRATLQQRGPAPTVNVVDASDPTGQKAYENRVANQWRGEPAKA